MKLLNLEILSQLTIFEKKVFNVSAILSSPVTISSFSNKTIKKKDLSEKQGMIDF